MKILIACEYSGLTRDAFKEYGWDAWSCDLLPTERPGQHYQGNVLNILDKGWDMLIGHPECTYLTNAGVRHLHSVKSRNGVLPKVHGQNRQAEMIQGAQFFNLLWNAPIKHIALENPVPHAYAKTLIGEYTQLIQPWQFGHGETKGTCLWLKNLPPLEPTYTVKGREHRIHMMGGKDRSKRRAESFSGISQAMAAQWTLAYLDSL